MRNESMPLAVDLDPAALSALTVDAADTCRALGISQSHFFALKKSGRFGPAPLRLGRCCRYSVDELRRWVAAGCPSRAKWEAMKGGAR